MSPRSSAQPQPRFGPELAARRSPGLLHPATIFAAVWLAVLLLWLALPDAQFERITGAERYVSTPALAYFALAIVLFIAGVAIGPALLRASAPARLSITGGSEATLSVLRKAIFVALLLACTANAIILFRASLMAGGAVALLSHFSSGTSWSYLAAEYFVPARIQGLTIWVQLNLAVAPVAVLALALARRLDKPTFFYKLALGIALANALFVAVTLSDRLAVYEFLVAASVAWLGVRYASGGSLISSKTILRGGLLLLVFASVWFASEFGRTYLARFGPSLPPEERAKVAMTTQAQPAGLAFDQSVAYLVTGVNNGMFTIDHFENRTLVYRSAKGLFTTLQLDREDTPVVGPGIREARTMLGDVYFRDSYTVYSLPGFAFMDLGWGGALVLFWFGLLIGLVYARFHRGELWACLFYPLLFVGLIDSFRIFYWPESRMLAPAIFLVIVAMACYRAASQTVPRWSARPLSVSLPRGPGEAP